MRAGRRTRSLVAAAAVSALALLAAPGSPAAASTPAAGPPGDPGSHGSELRHTAPDFNNGKKLGISKKESEKVKGQPPKGPAKVGKSQTWLALDDYRGLIYLKNYTLRGVGDHIEVWVANDTAFPEGDCRNALGLTEVTDAQVESFVDEFDSNMYPKESAAFSVAPARDGKDAVLPGLIPNLPSSAYHGEGDNTVVLVDNVRDTNYYDPTADDGKTYIAGFFYSVFNEYFDRNVMTVDAYDWLHRTGENPPDDSQQAEYMACTDELDASRPVGESRPRLYEGTFAHEYQHLLEYYEDPDEVSWVNEGLSDWAQTLVGYVDPTIPPDDPAADSHLACIQGWLDPDTFGGPENSLTRWGDQGQPEILCDYGAAYSFMEYLVSHYGQGIMTALHREDSGGLDGLQAVLDAEGANVTAQETVHNWAAMLAVDRALDVNGGFLNGSGDAADYRAESLTAFVNWDTEEAYNEPGAPPNGSDYVRLRDGSGTYLSANQVTSIDFSGSSTLEPEPVEWVVDSSPPDATAADSTCGNPPDPGTGAPALYSGCGANLDRSVVRPVDVPAGGASLAFDALWDTEVGWDFGYVQVSTDGGDTWTSLSTADTTTEHDPGAIPQVVDNLPGFDGDSGGWQSETADLSAYAGQSILLAFRYITDPGVNESGFWVRNVSVDGTSLPTEALDGWQSMTEVNPVEIPGWTVQVVAYGPMGSPVWVHQMDLDGSFTGSLSGSDLTAAIGDATTTVAAIVMMDDPNETLAKQGRYTLTVNGVDQPGG
jgi:hypothetical protein